MKKIFTALMLLSILAFTIAACGKSSPSTNTGAGNGRATVHLQDMGFAQSSITISKGSTLTLVDDMATPHILANGSWVNGSAQPMQEQGMPLMNNLQVSGSGSQTVGPFTTPGTFHLYCVIHPGMDLTVIVQ